MDGVADMRGSYNAGHRLANQAGPSSGCWNPDVLTQARDMCEARLAPHTVHGTEKPMELAFLNAAMHLGGIPVPDPWFSGEPINYYYFGYVALAGIALLSGATGEVAFYLGLATAFSLATVAGGGLAANLAVAMGSYHRPRVVLAGVLG
jgi:uncharacterized membrane protein